MKKYFFLVLSLVSLVTTSAYGRVINFAWDPVIDSQLTGYYLAFGNASGSYLFGSSTITQPTTTGSLDIPNDQTYYVAVKSKGIDAQGAAIESGWSNELVIPSSIPEMPVGVFLRLTKIAPLPPAVNAWMWDSQQMPSVSSEDDTAAVTVGTRFRVTRKGVITGVKYYKATAVAAKFTVGLYNATGQLMGSKTAAANDTKNNAWTTINFTTPIAVVPGVDYVVAAWNTQGLYGFNSGAFNGKSYTNGSVVYPANGDGGSNGLYKYGTALAFPQDTYQDTYYFIDVLFSSTN
jgi:hypothetical protein